MREIKSMFSDDNVLVEQSLTRDLRHLW